MRGQKKEESLGALCVPQQQTLFGSGCSARREQVISALSKSKRPFPLAKGGQMH